MLVSLLTFWAVRSHLGQFIYMLVSSLIYRNSVCSWTDLSFGRFTHILSYSLIDSFCQAIRAVSGRSEEKEPEFFLL